MSLRDDLEGITMRQTKDYKEESPAGSENINDINDDILGNNTNNKSSRENPFKRNKESTGEKDYKKIFIIIAIIVAILTLSIISVKVYKLTTADKGASFLDDMEDEIAVFKYNIDERELLRANGYTADDIERFEVEELNPSQLIREAEQRRKEIYDNEIKPYLDGASKEYKTLEELTWLGTGEMSNLILDTESVSYEERYGSYNCDYKKVPPKGSQLFLKVYMLDFNKVIFMTVHPERYNNLEDSGNIVVNIEYNKYDDGSILVTNVYEKDIKQ